METIGCAETVLGRTHGFAPTVPRIVRCQRKLFPPCQLRITLYAFILYTSPFRVGAHPCVRPGREAPLSCRPDFGKADDGVLSAGEQWSALKPLSLFPFITRRWRESPYQTSDSRIADTAVCGLPTGAADTGGCFSAALYSRRFREASSTPRQRLIWRLCSCSLFERGDVGYLPIKRPIRGSGAASRCL